MRALESDGGQEQQREEQSPAAVWVYVAAPGVVSLQILGQGSFQRIYQPRLVGSGQEQEIPRPLDRALISNRPISPAPRGAIPRALRVLLIWLMLTAPPNFSRIPACTARPGVLGAPRQYSTSHSRMGAVNLQGARGAHHRDPRPSFSPPERPVRGPLAERHVGQLQSLPTGQAVPHPVNHSQLCLAPIPCPIEPPSTADNFLL